MLISLKTSAHRPILVTILLVSAVLLSITPLGTANAQGGADATVVVPLMNLRAAPSYTGAVIDHLPTGTTVTLDGRDLTQLWVHGTTSNGSIGWLLLSLLKTRSNLNIIGLSVLGNNAPTKGGTGVAVSQPQALITGKALSGRFELGGQVQGLGAGTVNAMQRAGMHWVKWQVRAGDGGAAGLIQQTHAAGFKALLSVVGDKNAVTDGGYQSSYASYVGGLAAQGADALEVWNEENLDREWKHGAISPTSYVNLLAKAYNAIKAANGNTLVISGALSPTGAEGAFGADAVWNDDRYYAGMAAAGAGQYADCIGVHYNEGIVGPNQTSGDPRGSYPTRYFSTMLRRAIGPFGGKQACFTELGYLTPEGYGGLPGSFGWAQNTTVAQQASWLAQAAVRAANSGSVRLMIVFNIDFTYYGDDPQGGYAMIRPGGGCPACDALGSALH